MTETTATVIVGPLEQHFPGPRFRARHLLTLQEGFRATRQLIPLDPAPARRQLHRRRRCGRTSWSIGRPDAPQYLLAHGLLFLLTELEPTIVLTHERLAGMARASARCGLDTTVPDADAAADIAAALPWPVVVAVTRYPTSSIRPHEDEPLARTGLQVCMATASWEEPTAPRPRTETS